MGRMAAPLALLLLFVAAAWQAHAQGGGGTIEMTVPGTPAAVASVPSTPSISGTPAPPPPAGPPGKIPFRCPSVCPDTSVCTNVRNTPVCICPSGQRLSAQTGNCTSEPLLHSDWLDPMNNARAAVGAQLLVWDNNVEETAQSYADVLATRPFCLLKHWVPPNTGQNLAGGSQAVPNSVTNRTAVQWWVNEGGMYKLTKFDATNPGGCKTGKWHHCGHYIQLVWKDTQRVGCAVRRCQTGKRKGKVWVCNYKPAGNIIGRFPYKLDPCFTTYCPSGSTCTTENGPPTCQCDTPGEALVGGVCTADPCLTAKLTCEGDLVCDASAGEPRCKCPPSLINFPPESNQCIPPRCLGVECPGKSKCQTADLNPLSKQTVCTCPAGQYLVGEDCQKTVTGPLAATSMELFAPDSSAPAVVRFPLVSAGKDQYEPACMNLVDEGIVEKEAVPRLAVYSIVWNAPVSEGYVPSAVDTVPCQSLQFWGESNCGGTAKFWTIKSGNMTRLALKDKIFRMTSSIKCIF